MKREIIETDCDNCKKSIIHPHEHTDVTLVIDGQEFVSQWCDKCRAALKAKLVPDGLTCSCGYIPKSGTERGLRAHKASTGHD